VLLKSTPLPPFYMVYAGKGCLTWPLLRLEAPLLNLELLLKTFHDSTTFFGLAYLADMAALETTDLGTRPGTQPQLLLVT